MVIASPLHVCSRRPAAWLTLVGALGLFVLSACSGGSGSPASPSVVNVYNWADFIDPAVIRAFEEESGVKVHLSTYDSNEQLETLLLTGHSQYDVVVPGGAFFARGIRTHLYEPLDLARLPNLSHVDPAAARAARVYDPTGRFGVPYMWLITVGLAYDAERVQQRLPNAPLDSYRLFFEPDNLRRLQDCGVSVLDAPEDVVGAALLYLGRDPNSESLEDLAAAERVLLKVRPFIGQIDSTHYEDSMLNRETCIALGWGGDVARARQRARVAGRPYDLRYVIPKEGSVSILDMLAVPVGAPHPDNAYRLINYLLQPAVSARSSNETYFASPLDGVLAHLDPALAADPAVYPDTATRARLTPQRPKSQEFTRALTRVWARFRTGT